MLGVGDESCSAAHSERLRREVVKEVTAKVWRRRVSVDAVQQTPQSPPPP
jgi:hypothetical protein